jgi:phage I-like protein
MRMLTNAEAQVCTNLGISAQEFLAAAGESVVKAANSEMVGGDLTAAEQQICERLGITEQEYFQAKNGQDKNDMTYAMIEALERS